MLRIVSFDRNNFFTESMFDILVKNGTVIDGTGRKKFRADVGIKDESIVEVGDLTGSEAKKEIDAGEQFVVPGFIDPCNHSDTYWTLFTSPSQESLIRQGITTIIGGNCGSSLAPLLSKSAIYGIQKWAKIDQVNVDWHTTQEFLDRLETTSLGVNFATLAGHGTIRRSFVENQDRELFEEEQKSFLSVLEQSLREGAFGLSSGLLYTHGKPGGQKEMCNFARKVLDFSGVYATHIRNEMGLFHDAVREAILVARETGVKTHISHLKVLGQFYWNIFRVVLEEISREAESGHDITFDIFPYTASGSVLYTILPDWVSQGGRVMMLGRLRDDRLRREIIEDLRRRQIDFSKIRVSLAKSGSRKTIEEMAENRSIDPEEAVLDLLLANEGNVIVFMDLISEENIREGLRSPYAFVSSDGVGYTKEQRKKESNIHPRCFGAFPRVLRRYVREEKVLTWEEAIGKMTGSVAVKFDIVNRGRIREGYFADLVIFHPSTIKDEATFDNPYQYPSGIESVIINGKIAFESGSELQGCFGRVLRKGKVY